MSSREPRNRSWFDDDDEDDGVIASLVTGILAGLVAAGDLTLDRMEWFEGDGGDAFVRRPGDPDLVLFRADLNVQRLSSDLWGYDGRMEGGYGPAAGQLRVTHFRELDPAENLTLAQLHGLYRISWSPRYEFGIGFGAAMLNGDHTRFGASATLPFTYAPHPAIQFRIAPTWFTLRGTTTSDYDLSVALVRPYHSYRIGYRRLRAGPERLHGPYVGLAFHY